MSSSDTFQCVGGGIPGAAGGGCWPCFRAAFAVGAQTTTMAVGALSRESLHHLFGSANSCWVHLSLRMMYPHSRRKGHSRLLLQKSLAPQYDCQLQGTSILSHAAALRVAVCTQPPGVVLTHHVLTSVSSQRKKLPLFGPSPCPPC